MPTRSDFQQSANATPIYATKPCLQGAVLGPAVVGVVNTDFPSAVRAYRLNQLII
jgi:hypothetical protein